MSSIEGKANVPTDAAIGGANQASREQNSGGQDGRPPERRKPPKGAGYIRDRVSISPEARRLLEEASDHESEAEAEGEADPAGPDEGPSASTPSR